ncbi:MAG TPA: LLM class flavin-dependent oxidoreductase [Candidatus Limnocylindrales bacterium]|nr:LLM class flavin-dependent oxidoreductase [Candidatus Limnocylindrales bacterium]
MTDAPRIGVVLSTLGVGAGEWLERARRLEAAGYSSVWAWDHFVSRGDRTTPVLESWTMLSAAAASTGRVTIGPFVANVMNRHPAVLARMSSTLQAVSGGRHVLGLGIGGHPAEHHAYGIDFPEPAARAARLRETIRALRLLWTGGPVTFEGEHVRLTEAYAYAPPEPPPPILVGAGSPAGVRIAAELGDGWAAEAEGFFELEPRYREALAAAGRRREDQRVVLAFGAWRHKTPEWLSQHALVTSPREELARLNELGADEAILTVRTTDDVDTLIAATDRW